MGKFIQVELRVPRSGAMGAQNIGDIIDVSTAEAERMIAAGQAIPYAKAKREKAVKPKRETR